MKKALLMVMLTIWLFSCSKGSKPQNTNEAQSGFILDIKKNEKLATGEIVEKNTEIWAIHIWNANKADFEIRSTSDALNGYAYDKITGKSIKSDIFSVISPLEKKVEPGRYFVYVSLGYNVGNSRLAYSYTNFDVKKGDISIIKLRRME
jgi:hypothetical protein